MTTGAFADMSDTVAAIGMLAGAFGAHGLQKRPGTTPENLRAWGSAAQYAVRLIPILQHRPAKLLGSAWLAGGMSSHACRTFRQRSPGNNSCWCNAAVLPNGQTTIANSALLAHSCLPIAGVQRARVAVDLYASALCYS